MKKKQLIRDFDYYIDEYMYNCRSRKLRPKTMQSYPDRRRDYRKGTCVFYLDNITDNLYNGTIPKRKKEPQMKKIISFTLILLMCLSLCACHSKEVQNAESLIDAIGEVTVDSEPAILAAEKAYHDLTEAEKSKVANLSTLVAARASYEMKRKIQALVGDWRIMNDSDGVISFRDDYTLDVTGGKLSAGTYEVTENGVILNVGIALHLSYTEIEGYDLLIGGGINLVRAEDYDAVYDLVFVEVDLQSADIYDYVDFVYVDYYVDQFSGKQAADRYLITSKVYDNGLVYWDTSNSTVVETSDGTYYGLFPIGDVLTSPGFGRMEGTLIFIRAEYVSEYIFTEAERYIASSLFGNTGHRMSLHNYVEYPY